MRFGTFVDLIRKIRFKKKLFTLAASKICWPRRFTTCSRSYKAGNTYFNQTLFPLTKSLQKQQEERKKSILKISISATLPFLDCRIFWKRSIFIKNFQNLITCIDFINTLKLMIWIQLWWWWWFPSSSLWLSSSTAPSGEKKRKEICGEGKKKACR